MAEQALIPTGSGPASAVCNNARFAALEQMIVKEQRYISDLKLLSDIQVALLLNGTVVEPWKVDIMFCCLGELTTLHTTVERWMAQAVRSCTVTAGASAGQDTGTIKNLASVFIAAILEQPMLHQLYHVYTQNAQRGIWQAESELSHNSAFKQLIDAMLPASGGEGSTAMEEYLRLPVMRMDQLFSDVLALLNQTPPMHTDYVPLVRCAVRAKGLAQVLDSVWDNQQQFFLIQERLPSGVHSWAGPSHALLHFQVLPRTTRAAEAEAEAGVAAEAQAEIDRLRGVFLTKQALAICRLNTAPEKHAIEATSVNWQAGVDQPPSDGQEAMLLRYEDDNGTTGSFALPDAASESTWRVMMRLGQLTQSPDNEFTWWKSGVSQYSSTYDPLLAQRITLQTDANQAKITCACYYTPQPNPPIGCAWLGSHNMLWLCTAAAGQSRVFIIRHKPDTGLFMRNTDMALSGEQVRCIVHVPNSPGAATDVQPQFWFTSTVWIATQTKLMVYTDVFPYDLCHIFELPVQPEAMLHAEGRVYVGLESGTLLVYLATRELPIQELVAWLPLVQLQTRGQYLYVAAGSQVYVYHAATLRREKFYALEKRGTTGPAKVIKLMALSVHGLWLVVEGSTVVAQYEAATGKHLQDLDIIHPLLKFAGFVQAAPAFVARMPVHIVSLAATSNMLLVGTNTGVTLRLPLPAFGNVPVTAHGWTAAYHNSQGPVELLLPLEVPGEARDIDAYGYGGIYDALYENTRVPSRDLEFVVPHLRHVLNIAFPNAASRISQPDAFKPVTRTTLALPSPRIVPPTLAKKRLGTMTFLTGGQGYVNYGNNVGSTPNTDEPALDEPELNEPALDEPLILAWTMKTEID